jgi:hypothetical protein
VEARKKIKLNKVALYSIISLCSALIHGPTGSNQMSIEISGRCLVMKNAAVEAKVPGGLWQALADSHATNVCADGHISAVEFAVESARTAWLASLRENGVGPEDVVELDGAVSDGPACEWLDLERRTDGRVEVWMRGADRGDLAAAVASRPRYQRHEMLSRSESGLHYVRERKSGILRLLTEAELGEFSDPPQCEECGEQFGCEHYNCAGERLLTDLEVEAEVPKEWMSFAREAGISRKDLGRLRSINRTEGEYHLATGSSTDMRLLELVILLNESR